MAINLSIVSSGQLSAISSQQSAKAKSGTAAIIDSTTE
jgi:hypothetical protein